MTSPWADPSTPTEPGEPYSGPPSGTPYGPYGYPPAGFGYPAPYGYAVPYGYPATWWPPAPSGPSRPGQVITSAVLAFVQAGLVVLASLYVWMFVAIADFAADQPGTPAELRALTTEGTVVAIVQIVSAALLILAGVRALTRRTRAAWVLLLVGHGVQVILTGYWFIRLQGLASDVPGPDPGQVFSTFALLFAAAPLVGLSLALLGPGRRWFDTASA